MNSLLQKLANRINARNGLVVNEAVWQAAHNYHRFHHQAHLLWGHGPGIVTGLAVRAEAGSRRVWVQPGLAVDPRGEIIILEEQDSEVIGPEQTGLVTIFLEGTGQSPLNREAGPAGKEPVWVRDGYVIESAAGLPQTGVELARIRLTDGEAAITDAVDPDQPGPNELDLRFRPMVGAVPRPAAGVAIGYLGRPGEQSLPPYGPQAGRLARTLGRLTGCRIGIDDGVWPVDPAPYALLYLVEQGPFEPDGPEIERLTAYLAEKRGILLVESYRPEAAGSVMIELLTAAGLDLGPVPVDHPLLVDPFFFSAPPPGARPGHVWVGDGVVFSTVDYGRLWQRGAGRDQPSREQLRTALEWAANIVAYGIRRQLVAGKRTG